MSTNYSSYLYFLMSISSVFSSTKNNTILWKKYFSKKNKKKHGNDEMNINFLRIIANWGCEVY